MVSGKLLVGSGADFNLNLSAACKADHYFSMQLMRAAIGTYAFKYFLARQMLTVAPVCNRDKPARGKRKNMTFFTECEVDKPENRGKPGKPGTDHGFPSPILFKNRGLSPILLRLINRKTEENRENRGQTTVFQVLFFLKTVVCPLFFTVVCPLFFLYTCPLFFTIRQLRFLGL